MKINDYFKNIKSSASKKSKKTWLFRNSVVNFYVHVHSHTNNESGEKLYHFLFTQLALAPSLSSLSPITKTEGNLSYVS